MPRHHLSLSSIYAEVAAKQECEIWGCELSSSCRKFVFVAEDDFRVHILGLWTICVGDAEDELHMIAVESDETQCEPVTIAALQPSILPMVNINGLEITPPVAFLLTSGSGPVYISGQHITLEDKFDLSQEEHGHLSSSEDLCASLVTTDNSQKDESTEDKSSV